MGKFTTLREEFESETGAHTFADQQYIEWLEKRIEALSLANVSELLSSSLGECVEGNDYEIVSGKDGRFWIKHKELVSGKPLTQWIDSVLNVR